MPALRRAVAWLGTYRGAALAAFMVWAGIVAVGAQARPSTARWITIPSLGDVVLVVLGLWCVGVLIFYIWVWTAPTGDGEEERPPPATRSNLRWLVLLALLLAVAAWLVPRRTAPIAQEPPANETQPNFSALEPEASADGDTLTAPTLTYTELVGLVVFAGVTVGALIWIRRRMVVAGSALSSDGDVVSPIDSLVARVAGQLRLGDDPRSAVLLAYAELEGGLARGGNPRRPSETPAEHIRRVMHLQAIDGSALVELAQLYERARFSEHEVTVADQRAATDALERLRSTLAAVS